MQLVKSTALNISLLSAVLFLFSALYVSAQTTSPAVVSSTDSESEQLQPAPYKIETLDDDGRVIGDFVVGPGKVELSVAPGEKKTIELLVTNRTGETKDFIFEIEDVAGSRDTQQTAILLGSDRGPYTLRDYVDIPQTRFTLKHMERATIPVTVSLPADAEPGGRYGSVLVSTVSRDAELGSENNTTPRSAIVSRIGTLFFVTTPGDLDTEGALIDFSTVGNRSIYTQGPISLALLFENTGSVHLNPYGEVSITNILGDEVGFVELDPWFSLPDSLRTREVVWDRELLFGRYTATANVNRGYDDIVDTQTISFWVLPWKLLVGTFTALFLFFLLLKFIFSTFELKRK